MGCLLFSQSDGEVVTVFIFDFTDRSEDEVRTCHYALYRDTDVFVCRVGLLGPSLASWPGYKGRPSCKKLYTVKNY